MHLKLVKKGRNVMGKKKNEPYPRSYEDKKTECNPSQRFVLPTYFATESATFLVLASTHDPDAIQTVRSTLAKGGGLAKNVAMRDL